MTPRTDRAVLQIIARGGHAYKVLVPETGRDLERDLREARELLERMAGHPVFMDYFPNADKDYSAFLQRMNEKDKP